MKTPSFKNILLFIGVTLFLSFSGCDGWVARSASAPEVSDKLVVLRTTSPLSFGKDGGIDQDLLEDFASRWNYKIEYVDFDNEDELYLALLNGKGDLAVGRLRTPPANFGLYSGPPLEDSSLHLFCRKEASISNISDLKEHSVWVSSESVYDRDLQKWRLNSFLSKINIVNESPTAISKHLLSGKANCVVLEYEEGQRLLGKYYNVDDVAQVSDAFTFSWLHSPSKVMLANRLKNWNSEMTRQGVLSSVLDRYKFPLHFLSKMESRRVRHDLAERLPAYRDYINQLAKEHRIPATWITAVAYQESKFLEAARSHTGVQGLMQITSDTATHMGITDRRDPRQSLWAGAKYIRYLYDQTPKEIHSQDRWALALAAYNAGPGHLKDAQTLAASRGLNPWSWFDLKKVFPLMSEDQLGPELPSGPCRGNETIQFVERVRGYHAVMDSKP